MLVRSPQCGQTKKLMFSTTPSSGTFSLRNMASALRTSSSATAWGVVTMTAPVKGITWESESWASPVPGGMSKIR